MKNYYSVEYNILIAKVHRWGEIIRFGGTLLIEDIEDDIKNCIEILKDDRDPFLIKVFGKKSQLDASAFEIEAVDITILSLAVGIDLGLSPNDLMDLGIAALVKDIGMNRVPTEILNKEGELSEDEIAEIKKHPEHSVDIITALGFNNRVVEIVLDHHERWDGKGYPRGKSKESINYLSRIISVLDAYNALKEDRPYRESLHGYDVIKSILSDNGHRYDPAILNATVKSIGIYPLGAYVALNDASIAQVIAINRNKPLKPVVKVVINKNGTETKSEVIIDISDNNKFFIVKTVKV